MTPSTHTCERSDVEAAPSRPAYVTWTPQRAEAATALLAAGATVTQTAAALGVSRATIYRHANP